MNRVTWNRPLPPEITLGGEKRFSTPLSDPAQLWVISGDAASSGSLEVKIKSREWSSPTVLIAEYWEGRLNHRDPREIPAPPILDLLSWDWLEFHYHPLRDLEVKVVNWVPDPRVICGVHHISNHGSEEREISLKLTCQSQIRGSVKLSTKTLRGRKILSGSSLHHNLALFITEGRIFHAGPQNQLISSAFLDPGESKEIRWILVCCGSNADPRPYLNEIIKLDWDGELARRKILLSSQLQIRTGNPDWDFPLAFSQRQAQLILNQLFLSVDDRDLSDLSLSPLQSWQLFLALTPLEVTSLEWLLEAAFQEKGRNRPWIPLLAEFLFQAQQAGYSLDSLKDFLPVIEKNHTIWFSNENDKDGDGIPEEPRDMIINLENSSQQEIGPGEDSLETPGLAALLHNDICQLARLWKMIPGQLNPPERDREARALKDFILESWQHEESRFRTRDFQSHLSKNGFTLQDPIQSGWNPVRAKLPYPSRLILQIPSTGADGFPQNLQVTFHGVDWQGRYRVEEVTSKDILWYESWGQGITRSIFSQLDHCVVSGLERGHHLTIKGPKSNRQDLSHALPLLMESLPKGMREKLVARHLAKSASFWSEFGLKTYPKPDNSPIALPLNLLVMGGLIRTGFTNLAKEIFIRWIDAVSTNLLQKGCLYSVWDSETGAGVGVANQIESTLPTGFFLDLLGVRFLGTRELKLEKNKPLIFPVKLTIKGVEITLKEEETTFLRLGDDEKTYPRGKTVVIQF